MENLLSTVFRDGPKGRIENDFNPTRFIGKLRRKMFSSSFKLLEDPKRANRDKR